MHVFVGSPGILYHNSIVPSGLTLSPNLVVLAVLACNLTDCFLQVAPFFLQLEDEAGDLKQVPSGCAVKLGKKVAGVHVSESGLVAEVAPPNDLKAPASTEEIKVPSSCPADKE